MNYFEFRNELFQQGVFSNKHIRLLYPGFNKDNLLYWQNKGYIIKLRNGWYCFKEFLRIADAQLLIANTIYSPSYISHQQALMFYGMIPEHIVDSTSMTTKKTTSFIAEGRTYMYYSIKKEYYFGYTLLEMDVNGQKRNILMADREKALLDLLYNFSFYKTEQDLEEIRLNEMVMVNELDWSKTSIYLDRFKSNTLDKKIKLLQKIYDI